MAKRTVGEKLQTMAAKLTAAVERREAEARGLVVHRGRKREWLWTLYAANGRKIATTGESHKNRAHAVKMARALFPHTPLDVEA